MSTSQPLHAEIHGAGIQVGILKEISRRRGGPRPSSLRVLRLLEEYRKATVKVSVERAKLITEFYEKCEREPECRNKPIPVKRALAFKYLLERVSTPVEWGQLIVGIRGSWVKEVPTYPEICCHTLKDLEILNSRERMPYRVDPEVFKIYEEKVIPFWKNKTVREKLFKSMSKEWLDAYEAGIFTEFMEQRAPGHTCGGERIFRTGLLDVKEEIKKVRETLDPEDPEYENKLAELEAMEIVADAMLVYAKRYADKLRRMAEEEGDPARKEELLQMAAICEKVPARAPETFWEALQHYWFIHVGVVYEANGWDSFSPGRLDLWLYPFYKRDLETGKLTREKAKELLQCFLLKFEAQPAPPKVGVTAEESYTYNDFAKINLGGVDENGKNAVNELSYLIIEAREELMPTLQPNLAVQVSEKTPEEFLVRALKMASRGFGEPPFFNHDGIVVKMLRQGKCLKDARLAGASGCVESGAFGKEAYILTGYFNLPKILEITLNNGVDPRTGKKIGLETGDPRSFKSFDELWEAYLKQVKHFLDIKMRGNDIIEKIYADELPVPFLSLWIEDCVKNAKDYNAGGARYNTQYIQMAGLGTVVDSLVAIKYLVFDHRIVTMDQVLEALNKNWEGFEWLRQFIVNKIPHWGNDDDYVDSIAVRLNEALVQMVESYPPTPIRRATRHIYWLPTTVHVYFGKVTGATPDGRKAGFPVSEGVSPVQGMDRKGLLAVFKSVAKVDWDKTGGALLNAKLMPDFFDHEENYKKLVLAIRTFFRLGGHHVQFNVVSAELLREAQRKPQDFEDLMVRVAGYSDYFVKLPKGLQDEIIARTEHREL
ncbi:MAG: glycyl radical protein [Desulfurococcaceae archaeon]